MDIYSCKPMKRCSTSLIFEEMQIETNSDTISHLYWWYHTDINFY